MGTAPALDTASRGVYNCGHCPTKASFAIGRQPDFHIPGSAVCTLKTEYLDEVQEYSSIPNQNTLYISFGAHELRTGNQRMKKTTSCCFFCSVQNSYVEFDPSSG